MRHSQSSADITGSHSLVSHLHDPLPHHVRKRSPVDKDSTQLINSSMTCKHNLFILQFCEAFGCKMKIMSEKLCFINMCFFLEIILSNLAHPLYHCRRRLFSGGRTLTSNGIRNEVLGHKVEYKVFWLIPSPAESPNASWLVPHLGSAF